MNKLNLCLHTGAGAAERGALAGVITPARTATWVPIAHDRLVDGVIGALRANHMTVVNDSHGLTRDGSRFFGLLQIAGGENADDFGMVIRRLSLAYRRLERHAWPARHILARTAITPQGFLLRGAIRPRLARQRSDLVERRKRLCEPRVQCLRGSMSVGRLRVSAMAWMMCARSAAACLTASRHMRDHCSAVSQAWGCGRPGCR